MSDLTGELIDGRYELLKQIATGGMATIYIALDTRLDRKVAVKIMHSHLADDEKFVNRFIKEAKAAAALSHPNIVSVQDQGWNQGGTPAVFLVMEYVEGFTLREYLFEQGKLSPGEVIRHLIPILSALAAAHKIGIVHRDIKPENILISINGRIKVADFGLAHGDLLGNTLTAESSVILGSVSYLSPEQVLRGVADSRSDVYSVGIVAFELLTGEKPFAGDSPINIAYKHVNERVPAPSTLVSGIPESLDALVLRATSVNPDDRPRDAEDFLEELRKIQVEMDPKRTQMSLELDLPPIAVREKSRSPKRVSSSPSAPPSGTVATMKSEKSENTTQIRKRATSSRVRRNRWIAFLLVIVLAGGFWYVFGGFGSRVSIQTMAGMSAKEADTYLTSLGLHSRIEKVFSEEISAGKIISTDPGGGGHVNEGGTVSLIVSKGPERYLIPNVKNLSLQRAEELLKENSLVLGTVREVFDTVVAQGLTISATPAVGTSVRRNTAVDLIVSKGIEQIPLISYVGKSSDQALNELTAAGFDVTPTYAFSDMVPIGMVISQTPNGGTNLPKGTKIALVISKGSESVFIPNVYSLTQEKATTALEDLYLIVTIKKIGTRPNKVVIDVSPTVGSKVTRGSTVVVTVG
ncbi:MAG: Stk1 family PASTA domain-containing Ser/Thr kinase [Candidatus Nanopelagicaceae bacterium]